MSELFFKNKYGPWALLVGAAEGLGEAYTIALAERGLNIVMLDKNQDSLKKLAHKVESDFGIQTKIIWTDLASEDTLKMIINVLQSIDCRLLIYNAAYSKIESFTNYTTEDLNRFIEVNVLTQIKLVQAFAQKLKSNKLPGGILLMSSLAGLIGMQLVVPYAATKAFTWNMAEALNHELKEFNIDVMACIAGTVATPTYLETKPNYGLLKPNVMSPADVVKKTFKKLGKTSLFIPGFSNKLNYFLLTRILPRKLAAFLANHTIKKMYKYQIDEE
jgi:short-subunit dehydrogenase